MHVFRILFNNDGIFLHENVNNSKLIKNILLVSITSIYMHTTVDHTNYSHETCAATRDDERPLFAGLAVYVFQGAFPIMAISYFHMSKDQLGFCLTYIAMLTLVST